MDSTQIAEFAQSLRGQLIGVGDVGYDDARKLYNGMIDKRPLIIARCADAGDVMAAVNFGRDSRLAIAIRGGGHNGPGFGSVDDGLVIDLSTMRGVRVDPRNRTVRVGPAARLATLTMLPTLSARQSPSGSSRPLGSPA
jgi:hypothetical protein